MSKTSRSLIAALGLSSLACTAAADVKPDGGDYAALPPGTDLLVMYYQHPTADRLNAGGKRVTDNLGLEMDVGLLRYVHYTKWGDYIVDPQIIVPVGRQKIGLADKETSGLGDVIFGATLWTIADMQNGEHLGWSVFFTAPTGSDKNQGFALSNNRWATDFQVGYVKRIAPKWSVDAIGEVEFYQHDQDSGAKRDPLYQAHGHLRYHVSDATHLGLSYRHSWGAKDTLHGVAQTDSRNNGNVTLSAATFIAPTWQAMVQCSHDTQVQDGPLTRAIQTRLVKVF
ncbi:transporter [Zoogloea sp.]|uniref:transporter n=1 Tax=Zoogloea sp. TaxID=49181 RepID=UPI0014169BA5|nr:MAG: transporter [Zoogloea sp.]